MPNSFVVSRKKFKISLKLKPTEIELLRKSWAIVTSNESRASDLHALEPTRSRSSSVVNLRLTTTETNTSSQSNLQGPPSTPMATSTSPTANAIQSFSTNLFTIQFYNNFIGMDPEVERLIPSIKHQASAFAGVISVAIGTLEDLSKMKESLLNLGHLHARILGIDSPYFKIMGEALIKTFQDWFGNSPVSFPLELEEAWIKLYCFLANSIIQGGIDPVIEYNIQPARMGENQLQDEQQLQIDENDEIIEAEKLGNYYDENADKLSKLHTDSDMTSNYTESLTILDSTFKGLNLSKPSASSKSYGNKFEPSITSSASSINNKTSYIPNVASKNINKLKKSRGSNKEDCTIM